MHESIPTDAVIQVADDLTLGIPPHQICFGLEGVMEPLADLRRGLFVMVAVGRNQGRQLIQQGYGAARGASHRLIVPSSASASASPSPPSRRTLCSPGAPSRRTQLAPLWWWRTRATPP